MRKDSILSNFYYNKLPKNATPLTTYAPGGQTGDPNLPYHPITNPDGYRTKISDVLKGIENKQKQAVLESRGTVIKQGHKELPYQKREREERQRQEAQQNSDLAQTMALFTPSGSNTAAGAVGAENFVQTNPLITGPIMSTSRLYGAGRSMVDPNTYSPYFSSDKSILENIGGGLQLAGDIGMIKGAVRNPTGSITRPRAVETNIYSSRILPTKQINWWDEPGFKARNPNFNPEAYMNTVNKFGIMGKELPPEMMPSIIKETPPKQSAIFGNVKQMLTNPKKYFTKPQYSEDFKIGREGDVPHIEFQNTKVPILASVETPIGTQHIVNAATIYPETNAARNLFGVVDETGKFRHFYKSSGNNAGKAIGQTYPIHGIADRAFLPNHGRINNWFIKGIENEYNFPKEHPLYGYGNKENLAIANALDRRFPGVPNELYQQYPKGFKFIDEADFAGTINAPEKFFNQKNYSYSLPRLNANTEPVVIPGGTAIWKSNTPTANSMFFNPQQGSRALDWQRIGETAAGLGIAGATVGAVKQGSKKEYGGEQWLTKYAPGGAASPQVCYDKNGNIVPCAPGAHRTLIFTETPDISRVMELSRDDINKWIANNPFTKEAEDLKNYLIKNQPGEDIEIYPTYRSPEDDRIITTYRNGKLTPLNEILKGSTPNTRLAFMAHHGYNLFGQPYSQLGKKLQATTYDNCYLGSCYSGDIASSPEFKGLTNFHFRPGFADWTTGNNTPGMTWLGVNPNKNSQTGEAGVNNAFYNTGYDIDNSSKIERKIKDTYDKIDKVYNKYKDSKFASNDKRYPGYKELVKLGAEKDKLYDVLNKHMESKTVNPIKGKHYDINNPTNQPHIGRGSTLWFGDMFNDYNPQKYNTLDNWNLNRQPIRGRDYKMGGFISKFEDGGWLEDYAEYANGGQQWMNIYGPGGQTTDGCPPGYDKHPLTGDCMPNGWTAPMQGGPTVQNAQRMNRAIALNRATTGPTISQSYSDEPWRKRQAAEALKEQAMKNSELAQTLGSFTPSGDINAGVIGAESFVNLNPITGPAASSGRLTQAVLGQNPYGFNSDKILSKENVLGGIGLVGDITFAGSGLRPGFNIVGNKVKPFFKTKPGGRFQTIPKESLNLNLSEEELAQAMREIEEANLNPDDLTLNPNPTAEELSERARLKNMFNDIDAKDKGMTPSEYKQYLKDQKKLKRKARGIVYESDIYETMPPEKFGKIIKDAIRDAKGNIDKITNIQKDLNAGEQWKYTPDQLKRFNAQKLLLDQMRLEHGIHPEIPIRLQQLNPDKIFFEGIKKSDLENFVNVPKENQWVSKLPTTYSKSDLLPFKTYDDFLKSRALLRGKEFQEAYPKNYRLSPLDFMYLPKNEYGGPLQAYYAGKMTGPNIFKKGGEYDLSDAQIKDLINKGYKVKYI